MPRHLTLGHLKAFSLLHIGVQEAVKHGLRFEKNEHDARQDIRWRNVRNSIVEAVIDQLPPARTDNEFLSDFVDRVIEQNVPLPTASDTVNNTFDALRKRRGTINCTACAAKSALKPCSGDPINDPEVVATGDCIRPIRDVFDKAFDMAAQLYERSASLKGVVAELATVPGKPLKLNGNNITLTGKVIWKDVGQSRCSELELRVNTEEFDWRGLNLLPYCMMHELVCHVFQQTRGTAARHGQPEGYDALAEGWMDYVAAELVAGGPAAVDHGPWANPAIAEAARQMHLLRRDQTGSAPFEFAPKVALGWEAAFWVLSVFRRHQIDAELEQGPWDDFVDLSCQLNAHPWNEFDRGAVLPGLPRRLGRIDPDLGEKTAEIDAEIDKELIDALTRWRVVRKHDPTAIENVIAAMRNMHG